MANSYYNHAAVFPEGTLARGTTVDDEFEKIEVAFDLLPDPNDLGADIWASDVDAAGYQLNNLGDPTAAQDATTKAWVEAEIAAEIIGGGSPGDIPITSLGEGSLTALQLVRLNAGGTALEGFTHDLNNIGPAPATALQLVRVNGTTSGLEGIDNDILNVGPGAVSPLYLIRVNAGGTALEGVDPDTFGDAVLSSRKLVSASAKLHAYANL